MLEVQRTWYGIKPFDLGWHVGLWNLVGGVGFWLRQVGASGFVCMPAVLPDGATDDQGDL